MDIHVKAKDFVNPREVKSIDEVKGILILLDNDKAVILKGEDLRSLKNFMNLPIMRSWFHGGIFKRGN